MSRPDEMAAFVRILDKGGFAPAARDLGPRERRDARLTGYDVWALARKPLWRP